VRGDRLGDALNHLVVKDIAAHVERAGRREHHQIIQQQAAAVQVIQHALLLRHRQHFIARAGAGIGFAGQHARHGADRDAAQRRNFADF